jgi:hypothetical protein
MVRAAAAERPYVPISRERNEQETRLKAEIERTKAVLAAAESRLSDADREHKFRDATGYWIERPTGGSDETAARAVVAQLELRAELVKAGVLTPEEDGASRHGAKSIETNLDAWRDHLRLKGSTEHWYTMARRRVARVATDRSVKRLRDFTAATVERWP